jgi:hypothetical protein
MSNTTQRVRVEPERVTVPVSFSSGTMVGQYGTASWQTCKPCALRIINECKDGLLKEKSREYYLASSAIFVAPFYYARIYQDLVLLWKSL